MAQELPKKTSKASSPKVLPTKPSASITKVPRRLKKKAKEDPPVIFSMVEEAELEDPEEESLQRRPRKTPQAATQVFTMHIPFSNVLGYSC